MNRAYNIVEIILLGIITIDIIVRIILATSSKKKVSSIISIIKGILICKRI
jgi:hypothetical protein